MAKGNTWCKKLMTKQKQFAMKIKLGNEEGVLARATGENYYNARILEERRAVLKKYKFGVLDGDMPDKPVAKKPPTMKEALDMKPKDALPRVAGWKPRPFGKKARSGCVYNPGR
jgi:hypothetical protein